jgi:hypothetical protein
MTVGRDPGFAVVEADAVYFPVSQTCSPSHVDKCSLKTGWTSIPALSTTGKLERIPVG